MTSLFLLIITTGLVVPTSWAQGTAATMRESNNSDHTSSSGTRKAAGGDGLVSDGEVDGLIQWLKSGDQFAKTEALFKLGRSKNPRALQPMAQMLADKDSEVRNAAIRALGSLGDDEAIPILTSALDTERESVNKFALVSSLLELGADESKLQPHIAALIRSGDNGAWLTTRLQNQQIKQTLLRNVEATATDGKTAGARVKSAAILIRFYGKSPKKFRSAFVEAMESDDDDSKQYAIQGLKDIGDAEAVRVLKKALKRERGNARGFVEEALKNLGEKERE